VVGGIALILGAIFFLSLAFSRGWIGPELRVLIGLVAGGITVGAGALFLERKNTLLGHVLTPVGLAIVSISLIGATRLYDLIPAEAGLLGALLCAAAVAFVAVRNDAQLVAAFGLISVLVAPPLLGAGTDATTLAFVGVVLIGTTSIALWRSWPWLPPLAFLLSAPQAAAWIASSPPTTMALLGLGAYWALNVVAAGGESVRRGRDDLSPSAASLLLGNAAFVLWAGFAVLDGDLADYRGLFLVIVAGLHLALGGYVVARDGERNLFALLTLGTGIAVLTMAMPIQLGTPAVPIAWSAEAVALAWVAVRRGHPYSASASAILYMLAGLWMTMLYPLGHPAPSGFPFLDARAAALAFFLGAVGIGVWIVRDRDLRSGLGVIGLAVAMWSAAAVLSGVWFVLAATGLMVLAASLIRWLPSFPSEPIGWHVEGLVPRAFRDVDWREPLGLALPITIGVLGALAAGHLIVVELPILDAGAVALPSIPFTDDGAIGAAILIGGVLLSGWILVDPIVRRGAVLIAGTIAAYTIPFEVEPWAVAILWVGLGSGAWFIARRDRVAPLPFDIAAVGAMSAAAIDVIASVAPPSRLVVGPSGIPGVAILESALAMGAVALGLGLVGRTWPDRKVGRWIGLAAGVMAVYLASVVAVDLVGLRIGTVELDELRTQGQVVLSVLWAVLGVGAFVYGIRRGVPEARQGGLALLALATVKVFLFDLAALDVAYRVISFIALGVLLLISAWLWQRAQPKQETGPS
jgi:uncharacterized membrane protein